MSTFCPATTFSSSLAEGVVEGVGEVQAADVAVAGEAHVLGHHLVGLGQADGRGSRQDAVLVVVEVGLVLALVEAGRHRVAGRQEVLAEDVGDGHLLLALLEGVELAVGVLLEEVEVDRVVLPPVARGVAEEARAQVGVAEDRGRGSRKRRAGSRPAPRRSRSCGRASRASPRRRPPRGRSPPGAARQDVAHVDRDEVPLLHLQVVEVRRRGGGLDGPGLGLERRLAPEELGRDEWPGRGEDLVSPGRRTRRCPGSAVLTPPGTGSRRASNGDVEGARAGRGRGSCR